MTNRSVLRLDIAKAMDAVYETLQVVRQRDVWLAEVAKTISIVSEKE